MQVEFDLGSPSFTLLHRAGLAGLWMTLKQLEKEHIKAPYNLNWQLNNRQVTLSWEGEDKKVLEWLLAESFEIHDGLIALRGLDFKTIRKDAQVIVHQGILGTFLQHNSTHKSAGTTTKSLQLDEGGKEIQVTYKILTSYAYQDFANNLCDRQGRLLSQPINVAGWLNPGAVVRHVAFSSDTSFEEPPENAFVLLFAPVACYYYLLRSKLRDKRAQYALVIPEVTDIKKYAQYRQNPHLRNATYKDFHACGLGDAGLRFLTYETTVNIASTFGVPSCQVITLGTVPWATQQKTRSDIYIVEANTQICQKYDVCRNWLQDKSIEGKQGGFVVSSFARELIAENLAKSQPWYSGISEKVNSDELFRKLAYERRGLYQVIQKIDSDPREKLFVQACHEAIKFTYGQISEQAKKRGELPNFDRETVRIRTGLGRCKNAVNFREFITDFWSRAGKIPTLQEHWEDLIDFVMRDSYWKKSRDLALLALASYKGKGVLDSNEGNENEEDNGDIDIGL
ncbi:type I-MYXAN CRISPR-associated Cas8a1/Cmx1 [Scytonema sp. NUACC21]